ncbi:MAG: hypothetical protein WBE61_10655 [Nitrososphaeraceae archaeon]
MFKIPSGMAWDLAASLPVTSLTSYHALNDASLQVNESLLVLGASGGKTISVVALLLNMQTPYGSVCVETVLLPPLATYRLLLYESKVILHGPPPVTMPF